MMNLSTLVALLLSALTIPDGIPDFSKVGYRYSDVPIPEYETVRSVAPPADGSDATVLIQSAIDGFKGKGALLLEKGIWNVSGTIRIAKSDFVLRGEGDSTVLVATGESKRPLVCLGPESVRVLGKKKASIVGDYIPVGVDSLIVSGKNPFRAGDEVFVAWIPSDSWVVGLGMDNIPPRKDGLPVRPWNPEEFQKRWERTVVAVEGQVVYLENPLVMPLDARYGEYYIQSYTYENRITDSGIERIRMVSEYASEEDEFHATTAVNVYAAEHCWVRNVVAEHFSFCCVDMLDGAKNITVDSCSYLTPKARTIGSRKYGFYIDKGQLCLVSNCLGNGTRHAFSTAQCTCGPNVFMDCMETDGKGDCGPHMRWASGVLYDNVSTDAMLRVQDRSNLGPSHGWAGVTHVFWNCTAKRLVCQSPQITGKNYCIGCVGLKHRGNFAGKPDGEWISHGTHVEPRSLFRKQLDDRRNAGKKALPRKLTNKR